MPEPAAGGPRARPAERAVFESHRCQALWRRVALGQADARTKLATDVLVAYFLQAPPGRRYAAAAVQPTADVPRSRLYEALRAHPERVPARGRAVVVRVAPAAREQLNPLHELAVHAVRPGAAAVDPRPLAAYLCAPEEALLVRCPARRALCAAAQAALLRDLGRAAALHAAAARARCAGDDW